MKIKAKNQNVASMELIVPVDGRISIDANGVAEVSAKCAAALGSAIYASVAAGEEAGGYASIWEAVSKMSRLKDLVYHPNQEHAERYNTLYEVYCELVDLFDPSKSGVMNKLHQLRMK